MDEIVVRLDEGFPWWDVIVAAGTLALAIVTGWLALVTQRIHEGNSRAVLIPTGSGPPMYAFQFLEIHSGQRRASDFLKVKNVGHGTATDIHVTLRYRHITHPFDLNADLAALGPGDASLPQFQQPVSIGSVELGDAFRRIPYGLTVSYADLSGKRRRLLAWWDEQSETWRDLHEVRPGSLQDREITAPSALERAQAAYP